MKKTRFFQRRITWLLAILCLLCSGVTETRSDAAEGYDLKAVFLFNFAQFVEWPTTAFPNTNSPIVIGVLGGDPFGKTLDQVVRGEEVGRRKLIVKRYRHVEEIDSCHILFISESKPEELTRILSALKGKPLLTVGETDKFTSTGGMVRFHTQQNKLRLRINLEAVKAAGLTMSSKLLKTAEIVESTSR